MKLDKKEIIKYVKSFILIIFTCLFLTGCDSWEDAQKNYGDLLRSGVVCSYANNGEDAIGINSLVLSADYNGAYVQINGESKQTLISTEGIKKYVYYNGRNISFPTDVISGYLQSYISNGNRCPNNVYIYNDSQSNESEFRMATCVGMGGYCNSYKWISNSSGDSSKCTTKPGCNYQCATDCTTITKNFDNLSEGATGRTSVDLEFGYYKTADGNIKRYFGVIADSVYTATEDEGFTIERNLERYEIYEGSVDKIWPSSGGFIGPSHLKITASVFNSGTTYYISDDTATSAPGDFDKTDEDIKIPTHEVTMPSVESCNDLLGDPTTKGTPAYYLVAAFRVIKYVAIILLVVLTVLDYMNAMASNDQEAVAKATKKAVKRFVLCIIIFLLPVLLQYGLSFLHKYKIDLCGIS